MENRVEPGADAPVITIQTVAGIGEKVVNASFDVVDPVCTSGAFMAENGYFGYVPINPKN